MKKKVSHDAGNLRPSRSLLAFSALVLTLLLASCGGGGVVPSTSAAAVDAIANQSRTQTPEWAEYVSRKAVAYSPYRSNNRDTEVITEGLRALKTAGTATLPGDRLLACKNGRASIEPAPPRLHATSSLSHGRKGS